MNSYSIPDIVILDKQWSKIVVTILLESSDLLKFEIASDKDTHGIGLVESTPPAKLIAGFVSRVCTIFNNHEIFHNW